MAPFAGFNSSKEVRGKLQAAMYYNRKRRRERAEQEEVFAIEEDELSFRRLEEDENVLIRTE